MAAAVAAEAEPAVLTGTLAFRPSTEEEANRIREELTLVQKELSPLAPPGCLEAYAVAGDGVFHVPAEWGLQYWRGPVRDERLVPEAVVFDRLNLPGELRPHQESCVTQAVAHMTRPLGEGGGGGGGGAFICLPCGYGKSVAALEIARRLGVKALFVMHTAVLMTQWVHTIRQYVPHARVGTVVQNKFEVEGMTHVVGSLHSIAKGKYDWSGSGIGLVVFDEAHHIPAVTFSRAVAALPVRYRVGLSATPERPDGLSPFLGMVFGSFRFVMKREERRDLRAYLIRISDTPIQFKGFKKGGQMVSNCAGMINMLCDGSNPKATDRQEAAASWVRLCLSKGRKVIVIADRVGLLKDLERRCGVDSTSFLIGETKTADRERAGDASVIFATYGVVSEGFDCPALDTALLLTPRSGENAITQTVGRLLRNGGRSPLVVDFVDEIGVFMGMARKRERCYRSMGASITTYDRFRNVMGGGGS